MSRIHHHAQLVAHIEPDLRRVGREAEDVHVLGFETAHVSLGKRARLADCRRYAPPRRVNRNAPQKHGTPVQMELAVANLKGTEAYADGPGPERLAVFGRGDLEVVEHGRVRAPQLRLQAGDGLAKGRRSGGAGRALAQRTLPEGPVAADLRNGRPQLGPGEVLPCPGCELDPNAVGSRKRQHLLEFERPE